MSRSMMSAWVAPRPTANDCSVSSSERAHLAIVRRSALLAKPLELQLDYVEQSGAAALLAYRVSSRLQAAWSHPCGKSRSCAAWKSATLRSIFAVGC